jgi:hypothetical protein
MFTFWTLALAQGNARHFSPVLFTEFHNVPHRVTASTEHKDQRTGRIALFKTILQIEWGWNDVFLRHFFNDKICNGQRHFVRSNASKNEQFLKGFFQMKGRGKHGFVGIIHVVSEQAKQTEEKKTRKSAPQMPHNGVKKRKKEKNVMSIQSHNIL